jgi:hypothetical protein
MVSCRDIEHRGCSPRVLAIYGNVRRVRSSRGRSYPGTASVCTGITPSGPAWSDVHRLLAHAGGDSPADVRDRAILMLLAIYGMRSGEVKLRRDVPRCLR